MFSRIQVCLHPDFRVRYTAPTRKAGGLGPAFFKTNDSRQFLILTARKGSIRKSSQPVSLISIYVYLKIATFRGRRDFCHMPATRGVYAESGGAGFSVPVFPPVFSGIVRKTKPPRKETSRGGVIIVKTLRSAGAGTVAESYFW